MRPGILVLLETVARLWAAEDLYVALVRRVACFTARGAHCSATHRRCTLAGRVPISRKWITCNGCALKMNRSEEHTSELQSHSDLVCRLLLEKKKKKKKKKNKYIKRQQ